MNEREVVYVVWSDQSLVLLPPEMVVIFCIPGHSCFTVFSFSPQKMPIGRWGNITIGLWPTSRETTCCCFFSSFLKTMHRSRVFAVCLLALLFAVELAYPQAVLPLRGRQTSLLSRRAAQVGQSIHLTGNLNVWGEYFASVGLGTPPQYLNLQIDTGTHPSCAPTIQFSSSVLASSRSWRLNFIVGPGWVVGCRLDGPDRLRRGLLRLREEVRLLRLVQVVDRGLR